MPGCEFSQKTTSLAPQANISGRLAISTTGSASQLRTPQQFTLAHASILGAGISQHLQRFIVCSSADSPHSLDELKATPRNLGSYGCLPGYATWSIDSVLCKYRRPLSWPIPGWYHNLSLGGGMSTTQGLVYLSSTSLETMETTVQMICLLQHISIRGPTMRSTLLEMMESGGPNYRHWDENGDLDDIGRSTYENQHPYPLATSSEAHSYHGGHHGGQYFPDDGVIEEYPDVEYPLSNWDNVENALPPRANTAPPETQGDDRHLYMHIRDAWGNEQEAVALLDTGADDDWISTTLVNKLGHSINTQVQKEALVGDNGIVLSEGTVVLKWRAQHKLLTTEFNVFDFDHHDVIFGHDFLRREKVITWNHSGLFPLVADKKASTEERNRQSEARQKQSDGAQKYQEQKQHLERRRQGGRTSGSVARDARRENGRRS